MDRRPNIVIVVADDVTPSYHGCYGGPTPTPHIDRLAREGVRFERGYCNASLCCPSRYALFTGQFAGRSPSAYAGVPAGEPALISQNGMLEPENPTLARWQREAGYFTGHIGKWHSRFDTTFLGADEPTMPKGDPDDPQVDVEFRKRQRVAQEVVQRTAGFEFVGRVQWGNLIGEDKKLKHHNASWLTDGALDFLDAAAKDGRPFYLHLANSVPHDPAWYLGEGIDHRYTPGGKLDAPPWSHPSDASVRERLEKAGLQTKGPIAGINAGMVVIDDQIGAILRKLEELGIAQNTIVIYTADHGVPGKGSCMMIGQHLPFVMRWPGGVPGGKVVHEVFSWTDMVPTLCEACGVRPPAGFAFDGVSVLGALRGEGKWPREAVYHEMGWSRSIIKGRYQYIATRYPASAVAAMQTGSEKVKPGVGLFFDLLNAPYAPGYFDPDQLYDLQTDPYGRKNLAGDPARRAILDDMKAELRRVTATMPRPFPEEPDPFVETPEYQELLRKRREEAAAAGMKHYPPGDVPTFWYANLRDPAVA